MADERGKGRVRLSERERAIKFIARVMQPWHGSFSGYACGGALGWQRIYSQHILYNLLSALHKR